MAFKEEAMPRLIPLTLLLVFTPAGTCETPTFAKTYCATDVLLVPKEKATTVPDWKLREIEVDRRITGPELDFVEEKRCVTEMTLRPREVEQAVTVIESRPVTVTDPCTGKCRTEYQPCEVVRMVKVKVYDVVPTQREVIIRVPVLKPGPEAVVKKMQLDKTTAPAIERRYDAVVTPSTSKVVVPVPHVVPPKRGCHEP